MYVWCLQVLELCLSYSLPEIASYIEMYGDDQAHQHQHHTVSVSQLMPAALPMNIPVPQPAPLPAQPLPVLNIQSVAPAMMPVVETGGPVDPRLAHLSSMQQMTSHTSMASDDIQMGPPSQHNSLIHYHPMFPHDTPQYIRASTAVLGER